MRDIHVAAAQFEAVDNQPQANLATMAKLTRRAVEQGAELVSFHECSIPGYSWLQPLSHAQLLNIAEEVPNGPSVKRLIAIAREFNVVVAAGLLERDAAAKVYNTYVIVSPDGFISKFRKLHPFVNPHLSPGEEFSVVELLGCKIGTLICYDNNLPENVRITAMMGAEIILMPHVTGCLPSIMPGRGTVPRELWDARERDPARLRKEFNGPKGRGWLMRWLPTRAFENGVYCVFTNPIGWDYDTVKPGLAMILDPFGEVLTECHTLGDDCVVGLLTPEKLAQASGRRYRLARRPELYGKLVEPQESVTLPGWQLEQPTGSEEPAP